MLSVVVVVSALYMMFEAKQFPGMGHLSFFRELATFVLSWQLVRFGLGEDSGVVTLDSCSACNCSYFQSITLFLFP